MVTREVDPTANEEVRVQYVMKGYRGDKYSQVETLVYMAFSERSYAVFCRNLAAQIEEPILAGLIDRIARDEARHEQFFANLVAHCLELHPRRDDRGDCRPCGRPPVIGADIDAYQDKVQNVADAGIFGAASSCSRRSPIASPRGAWPTSPN